MRILACCPGGYYSRAAGTSYEYLSFVDAPRRLGHHVDHLDHVREAAAGRDALSASFLSRVRAGGYDLVLIVTHADELLPESLDEARRHTVLTAWNCDDDWRWGDYSSKWIGHYTHMVTTCRRVYEANRERHPNLLLSQWACTGLDPGPAAAQDIALGFVGRCYGSRGEQLERLRRDVGLVAYGQGVATWWSRWKARLAWRLLGVRDQGEDFLLADQAAVKGIWNRSRVSFAPLEASQGGGLQIKARVFDMGLSGTVMLCNRHEALHEFYEPGAEYVEYGTIDECIERARHLLGHEDERRRIAERYARRTRAEHLWPHRYEELFRAMGLAGR